MRKLCLLLVLSLLGYVADGQVTALSATGDGGFETSTTLAGNGWTYVAPTGVNTWQLGTVPGQYAGARCMYASNNGGVSWSYTVTSLSRTYIYRDIAIPTGATSITLSFYYKTNGENSAPPNNWDQLLVYHSPTTFTPTNAAPVGTASALTGATLIFASSTQGTAPPWTNVTATIPNTYAGSSVRIMFCWKNDGSLGAPPPAAVDNISLTYIPPAPAITSTSSSVAFGGVTSGTNSPAQVFTVAGTYLAPVASNITVTAPTNFQVSSDGVSWVSSYTIGYSAATLANTPVYVRFNAPGTAGPYSGNVVLSGGGATSVNVAVSGTSAAVCSGAPTAGTAAISPGSGLGTTPFSLSLTGYTVSGGISFQWQSSATGTSGWTDIAGATTINHNFTGISANTYYRANVTCGASTVSSNTVTATFVPLPTCTPTAASWNTVASVGYGINTFNITGFSGSTLADAGMTAATSTATGYLSRLAMAPVNLQQGGVYPANTTRTTSSSYEYQGVWIDFNNNGTFESTETVTPVAGSSPLTATIVSPFNFNITIPITAPPGIHLMRIRGIWESTATTIGVVPPSIHPCNSNNGSNPSYWSGNVVDYYVNIVPLPPTISATPTTVTFPVTTTGSNSGALTFSLSGIMLSAPPGNITVTAPTNFQVSADGVSWGTSFNVPYSSSTLASTTAYVRFNAPGTAGTYSGNVVLSGGGATPVNVAVSGTSAALCSGTPTAGTGSIAPASGMGTTPFTLSLSGFTVAGGLGFQWQSSSTGTGGWTDMAGATTSTYNFTGITANTYYRCNVSCGASTVPSNTVTATFVPLPTCTPTSTSWNTVASVGYGINTFNITGYSGSTLADAGMTAATSTTTGYLSRLAMTPVNMQQGGIYAASTTRTTNSSYEYQGVWIDFNNNGTFESTETVTPVAGSTPLTSTIASPFNFNITIPFGAAPGIHLMRIRGIWESTATTIGSVPTAIHPCNINNGSNPSYWSGNVVDYYVNIVPLPACSGTPTAGTIVASSTSNCTTFNPSLSLSVGATGQTYQWQSSTDDIAWTSISGATNATYVATVSANTYYRCIVTCTSSGLSATTPSRLFSILPCIIMPSTGTASSSVCGGMFYDNGGAAGNYACCSITGQYTFYPATPGKKVQLVFSYLTVETCCDYMRIYNGNSTAAPQIGANYNSNPGTITSTAADGSLTVTFYSDVSAVAAGWEAAINLTGTASNPITTQPAATSSACQGGLITALSLVATGSTFTYQWYDNGTTNSNSGGTLIPGATNASYGPSTAAIGTKYYYCVVRDACGVTTASNPAQVAVGAPPPAITGLPAVCQGRTITLANTITTGTWSTSNATIAAVSGAAGSATVTGGTAGNATITYFTTAACFVTKPITVNATPVPVTGTFQLCEAGTTTLGHPDGGTGTWLSATTGVATVGLTSGIVSGVVSGTATISYTNTNGCVRTREVTVNPLPTVTVTPLSASLCLGNSASFSASSDAPQMNLLSQDFNTALGSWTINSNAGVPADNAWQIATPPGTTGVAGDGSSYMQANSMGYFSNTITRLTSPSFSTMGGFGTVKLTFNQTLYSFNPDVAASIEYSVNGGPWVVLVNQITASPTLINDGGTWSAGTPQFSMDLPAAAVGVNDVRLRWVYDAQSLYWVIDNISVKGIMPASSFNWSGTAGLSCSVCSSTTITPVTTGINLYNLATTTSAGCVTNVPVTVTASSPAAISGSSTVCQGATTTLSNPVSLGVWSSADASIASVNSSTGEVLGVNTGNTNITYSAPGGCVSVKPIQVLTLPVASGPASACQGSVAVFAGSTTGSTWSSSAPAIAAITPSGIVTASNTLSGSLNIIYTYTATGCSTVLPFVVNPRPAITGATRVCEGSVTTLSASVPGGTWASGNTLVAAIDAVTGVVSGLNAMNTTMSYTSPEGCVSTRSMLVDPLPGLIDGPAAVCEGSVATLVNTTPFGIWTSTVPSVATVNSFGEVTPAAPSGNTTISYTLLATGCARTLNMVVNPLPDVITGLSTVCAAGATIPLFTSPAGGTWASTNTMVAAANASTGIVTGNIAGNTTIRYTLPTGCVRTHAVTVNPLPNSITGVASVCEGLTTDLNNSTPGGSWSSEDGAMAMIDATTGLVTGGNDGIVNVSYTLSTGCSRVRTVTVNPVPDAIGGTLMACIGKTSMLSSMPVNGVWSSAGASVATVTSAGIVSGVTAGTVNISYTLPTGCRTSAVFTVNPLPATISGNRNVCVDGTTILSNALPGGTWAVSNPVIASVDVNTGIVSGYAQGVTAVTYELPTGCIRTSNVTVNPLPASIDGPNSTCQGSSITLTNATPGGSWWSANPTIASIASSTGVLSGLSEGAVNVSYQLPTGCRVTTAIEVNALPADITGPASVCKDQQIAMGNVTAGGSWSVDDMTVAMIDVNGMLTGVNAGAVTVKYMLPTGCYKTRGVVVNPLPASITGSSAVCQTFITNLANATHGGVWSSSNPVVAPISAGGAVLGNNVGFSIISYTLPTGCARNTTVVVNALPEPITGPATVCAGSTIMVETNSAGGTWSTHNTAASITPAGMVTGVAAGTTLISYTGTNGCRRTLPFTVNALPGLISGASAVCPGLTTAFSSTGSGGTWTTDNAAIASVHPTSGMVTATGSDGSANITYTLPTGCQRSRPVMVYPSVDAIAGETTLCRGLTTTLTNTTVGGMWTTSNAAVAGIGANTGVVTGTGAGTATLAYVMPNGCKSSVVMVVNPLPANITGAASVCEGSSIVLGNATPGGAWTSSDDAILSVLATGSTTGEAVGSATITYALPTGCLVTRGMVVNALPDVKNVTGGGTYCAGGAGVSISVDGSQVGTLYKLMHGSATPVLTMVGTGGVVNYGNHTAAGPYTVTAVSTQGCMRDMNGIATVSINELVTPSVSVASSAGDTVCAGTAVTYTATGVNGGTAPVYAWKVNGTDVGASSSYTFVPANGDVVTVRYTSNAACPSPASADAGVVMRVMANLTPSVSIMATPGDSVCQGSTATFAAAVVNGGDAPVYTWLVNGSIVPAATGATYMYQPQNNDAVICKVNSSYRCPVTNNVSSNAVNMHVDAVFTPVVQLTAQPGVIVAQGTEVTFIATPITAGADPKFQWLINQKVIAGANQATFKTSELVDGDSVTCVVTAVERCANLSINSIVMKVTPPTGVTTRVVANSEIRLTPNPNNGGFTVTGTLESKADEEVTYEVTNMLGQVVYRGTTVARGGMVNTRIELDKTLANGMYMLNMGVGTDRKVFNFVVVQ